VITRKWSGLAQQYFKDGNTFGICFPVDLDVKIKAVLIGACFLIVSATAFAERREMLGLEMMSAATLHLSAKVTLKSIYFRSIYLYLYLVINFN
jgi:hypothetical protein